MAIDGKVTTAERVRVASRDEMHGKAVEALRAARELERHGALRAAYDAALDAEAYAAGLPGGALAAAAVRCLVRVRTRIALAWRNVETVKPALSEWWQDEQLARAEWDAWQRGAAREFGLW